MATAAEIVAKAASQIGVKESPANSNNVKYNTAYYGREVNGSNYAWCCAFVWWVFRECNASKLFFNGKKTASCTTLMTAMKAQKTNNPKPGDLVFFQFDRDAAADHIGILEKVNKDGTFRVIEGNTSLKNDANGGEVMRRTRKKPLIMCFIRPKYDDEVTEDAFKPFVKGVQTACGAKVDGIPGKETLSKTITVSATKNRKHPVVKVIQTYLNELGYDCGMADGIAGVKFTRAVRAFQVANGCIADGEITEKGKTWKKLLKLA